MYLQKEINELIIVRRRNISFTESDILNDVICRKHIWKGYPRCIGKCQTISVKLILLSMLKMFQRLSTHVQ